MPDQIKNFAVSTIATAPSPATSGTSLVVAAGEGGRFPATPFNLVIAPAGVQATPANAEVVRVTGISTDTFTIVRTQESSSTRTVLVGDRVWAAATAKTFADIQSMSPINTQTGDYTLVLGDGGKVVRMNKATAQVLTIPPQASVVWLAETVINVRRVGAGSVTITPGAGVTIPNRVQTSGAAARTIANQYGEASLHRVASDVWELVGDIA